jgi:hypothetical protein
MEAMVFFLPIFAIKLSWLLLLYDIPVPMPQGTSKSTS